MRYTLPLPASCANAAALACNVDEAIALYQQVRELDFQFFPGDPQVIVPVLAEQNGCLPAVAPASIDLSLAIPTDDQPPSPLPSPPVTPPATGTPVASAPVATPGW